jgi:hypothetical protein
LIPALDKAHYEEDPAGAVSNDQFARIARRMLWVVENASQRIAEDWYRFFERHPVLPPIRSGFPAIPLEADAIGTPPHYHNSSSFHCLAKDLAAQQPPHPAQDATPDEDHHGRRATAVASWRHLSDGPLSRRRILPVT